MKKILLVLLICFLLTATSCSFLLLENFKPEDSKPQKTTVNTQQPITVTPKPTVSGEPISEQKVDPYGRAHLNDYGKTQYDILLKALISPKIVKQDGKNKVVVKGLKIGNKDELKLLFNYITADYPEIYYIEKEPSYTYHYTDYINQVDFYSYVSQTEYNSDMKKINGAVKAVLAKMNSNTTEYEKSKIIHDFIVTGNGTDYVKNQPECYDIKGVLINKKAVCEGYAETYQLLMHKAGLQCLIVSGNSHNESHCWNISRVNGEWYQTDVTWDDPVFNPARSYFVSHKYLNITSAEMLLDHTVSTDDNYQLPECTRTSQNYFVQEGLYFTDFNKQAVEKALKEQIVLCSYDKSRIISIKFNSKENFIAFAKAGINLNTLRNEVAGSLKSSFTKYYNYFSVEDPDSLNTVVFSLDYE